MNQYAHVALAAPHDLGHPTDVEVGDHAQQHRLGHVVRQSAHECDGPLEVVGLVERGLGAWIVDRPAGIGVGTLRPPGRTAQLVDVAAAGDREQPAPEVDVVTLESVQAVRDVDPDLRRQIVRIDGPAATEVPQDEVLVAAPQRGERVPVARSGALDL